VNTALNIVIDKSDIGAAAAAFILAVVFGLCAFGLTGGLSYGRGMNGKPSHGGLIFPLTALAVIGGAALGWWLVH
jgi:hypothetical protein